MVSSGLLSGSGLNSQYLNALLVCPLPPISWSGNSSTAQLDKVLGRFTWHGKLKSLVRSIRMQAICFQYFSHIFNAGTVTARPRQFRAEHPHCNILPPVKMQDFAPALLRAYKHCYRMIHEGGNFFSRHRGFESCRYDMNIPYVVM